VIAAVRRLALAVAWLLAVIVMSLGSAGIVARWSESPGPARAELTWAGDRALAPSLDAAQASLEAIAVDVERLSVLARGALAAIAGEDRGPFLAALTEGGAVAQDIRIDSASLRGAILALPGGAAADAIAYGEPALDHRSALLAALASTEGLARSWATFTAGGVAASGLISLLVQHDATVAAAATEGRAAEYEAALTTIAEATGMLAEATAIRDQLANAADVATLDEWLGRNRRYDAALVTLYTALRDTGGIIDEAAREAYREESVARAALPPDPRGLVVIVADIGRGGLNQAVIAIERARGSLSLALEALAPAVGRAS
jgi:hypothetical protein